MSLYGRDDETWEQLTEAGLKFLIERARLRKTTSYTELNTVLERRTGLSGFDFGRQDGRAAMGHLLRRIVEQNRPASGLMISALVIYLDGSDAGSGFYSLAVDLGLLPRKPSARQKVEFWVGQLNRLHDHYAPTTGGTGTV
ncbi:hypothetical protein [Spongiactinospora sp. TRM90649]|uniref:hypothetical protein n=1 Tax=Spongiactinospora sp. TRM90649 TaxID=3031114 RepID=UPI0023F74814|nr:hypothetical protein [Spongiactinospora sp. TRM90649]MDF5754607.1 hypothetical protein [Spongiactinospora sp. TRM90649]